MGAGLLPVLLQHPACRVQSVHIREQLVTVVTGLARLPAAHPVLLDCGGLALLLAALRADPAQHQRSTSKATVMISKQMDVMGRTLSLDHPSRHNIITIALHNTADYQLCSPNTIYSNKT